MTDASGRSVPTRIERDSMGEMAVPADALYGASTQRAVLNFPISGQRFPRRFIRALALIKLAAAETNAELGLLPDGVATAIAEAAREVADGAHDDQFPIDIYQTGSGTSTNTNVNEVCRPPRVEPAWAGGRSTRNDRGQPLPDLERQRSPTALQLSRRHRHRGVADPRPSSRLPIRRSAARCAGAAAGRQDRPDRYLQDATPIRLGQEFQRRVPARSRDRIRAREGRPGRAAGGAPGAARAVGHWASTPIPSTQARTCGPALRA